MATEHHQASCEAGSSHAVSPQRRLGQVQHCAALRSSVTPRGSCNGHQLLPLLLLLASCHRAASAGPGQAGRCLFRVQAHAQVPLIELQPDYRPYPSGSIDIAAFASHKYLPHRPGLYPQQASKPASQPASKSASKPVLHAGPPWTREGRLCSPMRWTRTRSRAMSGPTVPSGAWP